MSRRLVCATLLLLIFLVQDVSPVATCNGPLGMKTGVITDSQVTASSQHSSSLRAANGRLGFTKHDGRNGAWSARTNNKLQWLQVDFGQTVKITGVATQGRQDADQWVKSYALDYSPDKIVWLPYKKVFTGNKDRKTIVSNDISPPITARFVHIHPRTWHSWISLRAEFYGCRSGFYVAEEDCAVPLGMVDRSIVSSSITASTFLNKNYSPDLARLYLQKHSPKLGSWAASVNDQGQFLQIDLGKATKITRIATQGRQDANQYVKSYRLSYSLDNGYYKPYGNRKTLTGNTNNNGVRVNILKSAIITRYIRVQPVTWHGHVCMRLELYGCKDGFPVPNLPSCQSKLSMSDDQMSASSSHNQGTKPQNARLYFYSRSGRSGSWSARVNDVYQFFELQFRKPTKVTRIATQGRQDASQWVKKYSLDYSMDGGIFTQYDTNGKVKIFTGNTDRYSVVSHVISPPIIALYIRVHPTTWQSHISMRLEFYGCQKGFIPPPTPNCVSPLGLRSGDVTDAKMTASSEYSRSYRAANGRLHFHAGSGRTGSWSARSNNVNQWLQVDFSQIVKIQRVATQGRQDGGQWVKSYSLEYSRDGVYWEYYQQGAIKAIFSGNVDQHSVVIHELQPAIISRFIRIHPVTWHSHISLRAEFYGCRQGFQTPPTACADALGMESKNIPDSRLSASSIYNSYFAPSRGRLRISRQGNLKGAWVPLHGDQGQWLQIDLGQVTKVTRIATQGRQDSNQWVTSYTLSYTHGVNGHFETYNNHKVFAGNKDRITIVGHIIEPAIIARVIRIHPRTWYSRIALRVELYGCTKGFEVPKPPKCESAVDVKDNQISASSEYSSAYRAANGRLHHMAGGGRYGAWVARVNDAYQYLQLKFTHPTKVTRVSTQGRHDSGQWVKTYTLEYSLDGALFVPYSEVPGQIKIFAGNKDQHSVVSHVINPPIIARYIRVRPVSWHSRISMRVQFYGCTEGFEPPPEPDCVNPLGCQCQSIQDEQFTASSTHSHALRPSNARLHLIRNGDRSGAWSAKKNDKNQWIQVTFESYKTVTRIATQGRQDANQWVTAYTVQYSQTGRRFDTYKEGGKNKVFSGNHDRGSVVLNSFNPPLVSIRMIRIHPTAWHSHISLRMEVYGCPAGIPIIGKPCNTVSDVGILLDRSGSVGTRHFKEAKEFLSVLAARLKISDAGNRMGIIVFDSTATRMVSFSSVQSPVAMNMALDGMPYKGGMTRIDLALELASADLFSVSGGDRTKVPDVLIVMTNGRTSKGSRPYSNALQPLKKKNVKVIVVGIGPDVNHSELLKIADGKTVNVIHVDKYEALSTQLNAVLRLACVKKNNL